LEETLGGFFLSGTEIGLIIGEEMKTPRVGDSEGCEEGV
jgi:hypothetical protein